jgi:hypothetical protein
VVIWVVLFVYRRTGQEPIDVRDLFAALHIADLPRQIGGAEEERGFRIVSVSVPE